MHGEMTRGGSHRMSQKPEACPQKQPRPLTVTEIRTRVEEIACQVAHRLQEEHDLPLTRIGDMEALPLDTLQFTTLMNEHLHQN